MGAVKVSKWMMDSPYDNDHEIEEKEIRTIRWELDLYPDDCYYTLDQLREMKKEKDEEIEATLRNDTRQ